MSRSVSKLSRPRELGIVSRGFLGEEIIPNMKYGYSAICRNRTSVYTIGGEFLRRLL